MLGSGIGLTDAVSVGEVAPFVCVQLCTFAFYTILPVINGVESVASFICGTTV